MECQQMKRPDVKKERTTAFGCFESGFFRKTNGTGLIYFTDKHGHPPYTFPVAENGVVSTEGEGRIEGEMPCPDTLIDIINPRLLGIELLIVS